jgi:hypothetical protein
MFLQRSISAFHVSPTGNFIIRLSRFTFTIQITE